MCQVNLIAIIGLAVLVLQPIDTATIGSDSNAVCRCTREYSPICGSNNITYDNNCVFDCAKQQNQQLSVQFNGICDKGVNIVPYDSPCICTMEYSPVCGSDEITYGNECALKCEQSKVQSLTVKHVGECSKPEQLPNIVMNSTAPVCICTLEYRPVCATDGQTEQTYSNPCEFNCQKRSNNQLVIKYTGKCEQKSNEVSAVANDLCICPLIYAPVCGNDENTYSNECALNCAKKSNANLTAKYSGSCAQNDLCICTLELNPLCGSDGNSYGNQCEFVCAQKKNPQLSVKHYGDC